VETFKEFIGMRFGWPQGIRPTRIRRVVLVKIRRTWTGSALDDRIVFEMFGTLGEENEGFSRN
jgi:hypothetical protein